MVDVSVVMSVHDDARFVAKAVNSVLGQKGISVELIAIDDGSTDGSGEILDALAERDERLRVIHQENAGLTLSLIRGCALASGRYIARQDADDISFPGRLRRLCQVLDERPDVVLAASAAVMVGPDDELLNSPASALSKDSSCHGTWMVRRSAYEAVGGYRAEFRAAQDVDLRFRLGEIGELHLLPEVLYAFRIMEGSISSTSPVQKELSRIATRAFRLRAAGSDEAPELAEAARLSRMPRSPGRREAGTGDYFIGRCLAQLRDRRALRYLWRACRQHPARARVWIALAEAVVRTGKGPSRDVALSGIVAREPSAT